MQVSSHPLGAATLRRERLLHQRIAGQGQIHELSMAIRRLAQFLAVPLASVQY